MFSFLEQTHCRDLSGRAVYPDIGDAIAPPFRLGIQALQVRHDALLGESRDQRVKEAIGDVADAALGLSLGLGPIRLAESREETVSTRESEQVRLELVLGVPIGIASTDHRSHVVVEDLVRYAAERGEHTFMTRDQHLALH